MKTSRARTFGFRLWVAAAAFALGGVATARAATHSAESAVFAVDLRTVAVPAIPAQPPAFGRLINLSILTNVTAEDSLFTVGTVIGGAGTSGTKALLIRAAGPSLAPFGVAGVLADPKLDLFSGQTVIGTNDNWGGTTALSSSFTSVGAFAYTGATSRDSAIFNAAQPAGGYTVQVSGVAGAVGTVIAELYDATPSAEFTAATPRLINVSVLKRIGAGEILTAGFVIGGSGSRTVIVRAIGPTLGLAPFNVPGAIADPQLTLYSGQTNMSSNDNWGGLVALTSAFSTVGAFALPSGSRDAALLATLPPGSYTVQVSGAVGTTGVVLVELYEVDDGRGGVPPPAGPAPAGMVLIPAGPFVMGDTFNEGFNDERPTRTVNVSAFLLAKTETTWAEWKEVRDWAVSRGYTDLAGVGAGKADTHPVQTVTWYEVVKWLNAKSEKEGLAPVYYTNDAQTTVYRTGSVNVTIAQVKWTANGYRLPTEAEWEKAARGGVAGQRFPSGNTITHQQANYFSSTSDSYDTSATRGSHPTYATGALPHTSPVGAFAVNGYGLADMAGNVWEWCWDWFGTYSGTADPRGGTSGSDRVSRGGGWNSHAFNCRAAFRGLSTPSDRYYDVGFRPARSSVP